jgi:RNA polymerase sigma-70 factor (ECF subfamily)
LDGSSARDLAQLVAEHHEAVFRWAFRLCGSTTDAEDLTQQTFLTAGRCWNQLRDRAAARAWLSAILRTCFLKSVRRRRPLAAADHELDLDHLPGPAPEPSAVDSERLQQALDALSPEARVILNLFYFEDRSYREIAAALEIPVGTVMSRLSRAKEQLRRRLAEREEAAAAATRNGATHEARKTPL